MKRADKRSSINILVLGDEGVGKSSLISTFVSRYFSPNVPGIMTRVRLPPDPENSCITTIIDSQGGDAALISAVATKSLQSEASSESLQSLMERAEGTAAAVAPPSSPSRQQQQQPVTPSRTTQATAQDSSSTLLLPQTPTTQETAAAAATTTHVTTTTSHRPGSGSGGGMVDNVDSIVLVYDLDRVETFFRLERHWLPLIQRCYDGKVPVIVAENKMDLFRPSSSSGMTDEQALARKRQQIVSLMQQFPFVRQCIKCSAKNLLRVDDVFLKAQQAVLYPFTPPLYDLETGRLTLECKRAFTRIFRMYDRDHDGLLSDSELDRFQRETYHAAVFDRDFAAWKKVVTRNNPNQDEVAIQDGKFTVAGFLTIFDVFISINRLEVVWQALRKFGYDDDLNLHVPESVTTPVEEDTSRRPDDWKLTASARKYLAALFHQFDSDRDGRLSQDDIISMFSILPPPALPPWHPVRAPKLFEGCFSLPKESSSASAGVGGGDSSSSSSQESGKIGGGGGDTSLIVPAALSQSLISSSGISILSANDSLPSVDVHSLNHQSMTFLEWMGHWHQIAAISPAVARAELFRLGHVEEGHYRKSQSHPSRKSRRRKTVFTGIKSAGDENFLLPDASLRSRETRVLVLGSQACGKTTLLNALCGNDGGGSTENTPETSPTTHPETSTTFVKLKKRETSRSSRPGKQLDEESGGEEIVVHLVFTDVPETAAASQEEHYRELSELFGSTTSPKDRVCDLAMLVFDSTERSSWMYSKELESTLLTNETPRVFVATKIDAQHRDQEVSEPRRPGVLDEAEEHCRELDLESPLLTSATRATVEDEERRRIMEHLARCALNEPGIERLNTRPHEEQKRREAARRRKMMWLGGIVSVGVVVAVGMGLLWGGGSSKKHQKSQLTSLGWLRSWFTSSTVKEAPQTS